MAQNIINTGNYSVIKDGQQVVSQESFSANTVTVFEDDDFSIVKTPDFTVWQDTTQPLRYTIRFSNLSGTMLDSITIADAMPVADTENAGLTLDTDSIEASITPAEGVVLDTEESTASQLSVIASGTIAVDAEMEIVFSTNYVPPIAP